MKKNHTPISLWSIRISESRHRLADCRKTLTADEQTRAEKFLKPADQERYILCRGTLRRILGDSLNIDPAAIEFKRNAQGKPYLPNCELEFNLSHSRDRLLIAVTEERAVGVDIEFRRDGIPMDAIAKRWFAPAEKDFFQGLEKPTDGFFDIWAKKEAYVKARGEGIFRELNSFCVPLGSTPSPEKTESTAGWFFQTLEIDPAYAAAIVSETPAVPVQLRSLKL